MNTQTDKILEKAINSSSAQPAFLLIAQQIIDLNVITDQPIILKGGTSFIITDIVLSNPTTPVTVASDAQIWSLEGRTGISIMSSSLASPDALQLLNSNLSYVNNGVVTSFAAGAVLTPYGGPDGTYGGKLVGQQLYLSLGIPEGNPLTCEMYIYGTILS